MASGIAVELVDRLKPSARECLSDARRLDHLHYADLRLEISEGKYASSENGAPKASGEDYAFALGVRVLAGDRTIAPGYVGVTLGAADAADLPRLIREAIARAHRRAVVNAEQK